MRPLSIRLTRDLPVPLEKAFAWLTDFQDDDDKRAGAVVARRKVLVRETRRVVYEGETEVLGRRNLATTEVILNPPASWEARVTAGPRKGSWTTYALTPTPTGCRLDVHYRFVHERATTRILMRLVKARIAADLARMWDGYEADMRREMAARPAA